MDANQFYEKLKNIEIPLIHVDNVPTEIEMDFNREEMDKYISILEPKYLLIDTSRVREFINIDDDEISLDNSLSKIDNYLNINKKYVKRYIKEYPNNKSFINEITNKSDDDIGALSIGFPSNGNFLGILFIDDWFAILVELIGFINEKIKEEDSLEYWDNVNKEREKERLRKEKIEKNKEDMIKKLEKLTELKEFNLLTTTVQMINFWEKKIPNIYDALSRTFVKSMATKYAAIKREEMSKENNIRGLMLLESIKENIARLLVSKGILTLQDVADCSIEDLVELSIESQIASQIIIDARKHLRLI